MNVIINLDKPKGISSHQAVSRVRRILGLRKAGHAGTLDPIATGILLVCAGEATKITRFLSELDKEYMAVMKLGEKTDTYDAEGNVTERHENFTLEKEDIRKAAEIFLGAIEQVPPMFSAVKIKGKPLYKLARKGITVERARRSVFVRSVEITVFDPPFVGMKISCSKGTYIRSLCNDIGEVLGVGAHLVDLRRTRIGGFLEEDSVTLNELNGTTPVSVPKILKISGALSHLREIVLTHSDFARARQGLSFRFRSPDVLPGDFVRVNDPSGSLFAIGKAGDTWIKIERILHI
jgi:tRNA pseudouridine55 synthase